MCIFYTLSYLEVSVRNEFVTVITYTTLQHHCSSPLELHLTTSELWFGQEQEGILP